MQTHFSNLRSLEAIAPLLLFARSSSKNSKNSKAADRWQRLPLLGLLLVCMWMLNASPAWSAVLPKGVTQTTTMEGITEYRLANGLKVLLLPDASKPTVTVNITYLVGSRHENYGETGMAHLLEHMLFKGTPKNPNIPEQINQRGMRNNAYTWLDRTNYFEIFQASDDNLKWVLSMEADRMINSTISKKDLDSEMSVVRNEFEIGENNSGQVMQKRMQSVAFDWHNYSHATIGNRSDIENVKIENLRAFYKVYYQPDNAVLMVAGKFDDSRILELINKSFGVIAKPKRSLPVFWTQEPTQDGERTFEVRRKGGGKLIHVAYKTPATLHPDNLALDFAQRILVGAPNGRLYKQLVTSGKAVEVAGQEIGSVAPGLMVFAVSIRRGDSIPLVREALLAGIEDFKANPPIAEEIDRVKRERANSFERMLNDPDQLARSMSEYVALGDWRYIFKERDNAQAITAKQISDVVSRYFVRDNRTIGYFIAEDAPQRAEIPVAPSIEDVMKDVHSSDTTALAEVFDTSPTNLDKRTERLKIGGLDVALLPKKTRGETVNVVLSLQWGDEKNLFDKGLTPGFTSALLMTGTSKYTRAQLVDEMSKLKLSGNAFSFQTTKENLPAAIALMSHVVREPVFPEAEFAQARKAALGAVLSSRNEPSSAAGQALSEYFNRYPKGDVRYSPSVDEAVRLFDKITIDDIRAFHKNFFGASRGQISVVGDFDVEATKTALAQGYGDWKSAAAYTRLANRFEEVPPTRKSLNTPDKENGFYIARQNISLKDTDADFIALRIADYIFGSGGLNSRLVTRIRQKDGLSYSSGSNLVSGGLDPDGRFEIRANVAPQNMAKLEAAIKEELERAVKDGFTAEEVARAKSGYLQQRLQARTSDVSLAASWNSHLYRNTTWAWSQELDNKVQSVTTEEVNAAWRKYIDPTKLSVFVALDEAKAKAAK